jgi:homoserine O-acetyltransferase
MIKIPISYQIKYLTFSEDKSFLLESGEAFGPITVAYETFGTLNEDKSNAILVIHALTGDTHCSSYEDTIDETPGWWDVVVGKGKAIDTNKHFVICTNCFGGCMGTTGPSSINPETNRPYGTKFPLFTVRDMINVQKAVIDHLGIERLKCVVGGSFAGMQALEWSVVYPDMVERAILIASAAKTSPLIVGFGEVGRNAIMADPDFNDGDYGDKPPVRGLSIARMLAHITYLSRDSLEAKFGRDIREDIADVEKLYGYFGPMFQVESYLRYQGKKFTERFDTNSYLYLTKVMDLYELTRGTNDLTISLFGVKAKMLIISFESDWHFRPIESYEIVKAMMRLGKEISYVNIDSPYGHDSFLLKNNTMSAVISSFLSNGSNENINF